MLYRILQVVRPGRISMGLSLRFVLVTIALVGACLPVGAQAYVGPGAGITAIGSLLALVAGILFAVIGFVWYPVKRMRRRRKQRQVRPGEAPKA